MTISPCIDGRYRSTAALLAFCFLLHGRGLGSRASNRARPPTALRRCLGPSRPAKTFSCAQGPKLCIPPRRQRVSGAFPKGTPSSSCYAASPTTINAPFRAGLRCLPGSLQCPASWSALLGGSGGRRLFTTFDMALQSISRVHGRAALGRVTRQARPSAVAAPFGATFGATSAKNETGSFQIDPGRHLASPGRRTEQWHPRKARAFARSRHIMFYLAIAGGIELLEERLLS